MNAICQFNAVWNDAFAVGDAVIDAQHQAFFLQIDTVSRALDHGQGWETVMTFYRTFCSTLVRHFRDEEVMLERIAFPDLDNHRAEHTALLASVAEVEEMLLGGENAQHWRRAVKHLFIALVEHLAASDMRYKSHVQRANGY